ncbi:hypothetical protein SS50377_23408 [Spironucleus salmonicida]|uniref:Uncharacterized protein n=1 Tax=Spironucleus salmonicida TaxID=348837 RepID=V6M243_9EUKA|nr:hypothetical protein SS50377_23408 [Spironucleus salmonicida]|eukprot:EST47279.1 Hypothetical protein SS50377_12789 [Spironucleus salmonicida]
MLKLDANTYVLTLENQTQIHFKLDSQLINVTSGRSKFEIPLQISPVSQQLKVQIDKSYEYFTSLSPQNTPRNHIVKGLLCSNRECCRIVENKRSAYCCQGCQIREQNLRQGRVQVRKELITKKHDILDKIRSIEGCFGLQEVQEIMKKFG